jgi:hypothetical protein
MVEPTAPAAPTSNNRRAVVEVELPARLPATLLFRMRGDEVELDATVVAATANTIVVELASGASTLVLATARRCDVLVDLPDGELRASARPGRRVGDVPESNQLELVVTDQVDLSALLAG